LFGMCESLWEPDLVWYSTLRVSSWNTFESLILTMVTIFFIYRNPRICLRPSHNHWWMLLTEIAWVVGEQKLLWCKSLLPYNQIFTPFMMTLWLITMNIYIL
jgi:hypothetical protein